MGERDLEKREKGIQRKGRKGSREKGKRNLEKWEKENRRKGRKGPREKGEREPSVGEIGI